MVLQKQQMELSLASGIDTKTDPKQVIPGKLIVLENGVFQTAKEMKLRNGYGASFKTVDQAIVPTLGDSITIPEEMNGGNILTTFNKELILDDSNNLYSQGTTKWYYKGVAEICTYTSQAIIRNSHSQTMADSAIDTASGLQVYAWEDSTGGVKASIIDTANGQIIINSQPIAVDPLGSPTTSSLPKCINFGGFLMIFFADTHLGTNIRYVTYTYATGFSAAVTVSTSLNPSALLYDIVSAYGNIYLAYQNSSHNIIVQLIDALLHLGNDAQFTDATDITCITVFPGTGYVWLGWGSAAGTIGAAVDAGVTSAIISEKLIDASQALQITGIDFEGIAVKYYYTLFTRNTYLNDIDAVGVVGTPSLLCNSVCLYSKVFSVLQDGLLVPHMVVVFQSALQSTYFLISIANTGPNNPFNLVMKMAEDLAGGFPVKNLLASINTTATNIFQVALIFRDLVFTSTSAGKVSTYSTTGVISGTMDFTTKNPSSVYLGQDLHIGSGQIIMYDGVSVIEHGFHIYPEGVMLSYATTGSNDFGYQVTYEWTDNQGQIHRSAPSPVVTAAMGTDPNTNNVTLTIPTLTVTNKANVVIGIYRTTQNGNIYYRINNNPNSPLMNNRNVNTVTFVDSELDSSIIGNEQLYTTGEVENIAAPAANLMWTYKNRVILIPSDNPYSWWFSKQVIPGSPVEFSDLFVENVGTIGGPLTAGVQLDSNNILFKANSIYYVVGDGPAPSGANNDFTEAQLITADAGCTDPQSIVLMPQGVMFKSAKGIYLLDRSLAVHYIGAEVEGFNSNYITSAQLITSTNQVRFTLDNGTALVYDYFFSQWSVFTRHSAVSSTISNNLFTHLQSDGLVLQETPGIYNDNGQFIKMKITTGWLKLAGIQGYQRIYKMLVLGEFFGPHQLLVQFAYDFNPVFTQSNYINASNLLPINIYGDDSVFTETTPFGGKYPLYQWRMFTNRQLCEAIQVSIESVPQIEMLTNDQGVSYVGTYNQAMSISALSFEVGVKKGLNKMPAVKSFG